MWNFKNDKYILVCNEINKNLEWYYNDNWEEEVNGKNFKAFNGESEGIIWMVKFYYELKTIGIIKSNNDEVEEEEIFDYESNKNICEILDIPFKEKTTIKKTKKTKKTNKIEISDNQVNEKIKSNKKFKRNSYWIFPIWFFISIVIISNEFYWIGWISLIISILYFYGAITGSPTKFGEVKKDLIKKERDRLNEIKRKEREKELERKRIEREKEQLKINQEKTGFKLSNTFLTEDKFDGTIIISTKRHYEFKSQNISNQIGVNQSINLYDNYFTMPSVRISKYKGLWCSVLMIQKDKSKEFFIEFHFRNENLTNSVNWSSEPTCENSSIDILIGDEKYSQDIQLLENIKDENKRDITYSNLKIKQTFRFQIDLQILKKIGRLSSKIRLSNFPNVAKTEHWEFSPEMNRMVKTLVREFTSDMG